MNKKAFVTFYFVFIILAIVIIVIAAVVAPMAIQMNTELYLAGEKILLDSNESIQGINDTEVRAAIQASIGEALESTELNINVNADLFQYSWVLILVLGVIVIFIITRQTVEVGKGGFI